MQASEKKAILKKQYASLKKVMTKLTAVNDGICVFARGKEDLCEELLTRPPVGETEEILLEVIMNVGCYEITRRQVEAIERAIAEFDRTGNEDALYV
jgi:hypothetical protein